MYTCSEWIVEQKKKLENGGQVVPQIVCADGFKMSVQASWGHYCEPREDDCDFYYKVEVGFPSEMVEEFMEYAEEPDRPTETVYGWVPASIVDDVIEKHGGIAVQ